MAKPLHAGRRVSGTNVKVSAFKSKSGPWVVRCAWSWIRKDAKFWCDRKLSAYIPKEDKLQGTVDVLHPLRQALGSKDDSSRSRHIHVKVRAWAVCQRWSSQLRGNAYYPAVSQTRTIASV